MLTTERTKMDTEMPPDILGSVPTHTGRGILWLVAVHVAVGFVGALLVKVAGRNSDLAIHAYGGFWFGQLNMLGIWLGLGNSPHWKRLVSGVLGVGFLHFLFAFSTGNWTAEPLVHPFLCLALVATPLLFARCFGVAVRLSHSPTNPACHFHFFIRHLLIMTFVIACMIALGKLVYPLLAPHRVWVLGVIRYAVMAFVFGVIPVWLILATTKPVPYGIGWMATVACMTYSLGRSRYADWGMSLMSAVMETVAVVASLLIVRSWGYRLVRLPRRDGGHLRRQGEISVQPGK